jgi:Domain of unknown function (DUF4157)
MRSRQHEATAQVKTPAATTSQTRTPARPTNPLLALQRGYGNRFVQRLVRGESTLDPGTRARLERAFGTDLSSVTVARRPEAASIGALAYTQGEHIGVAPSQQLNTAAGKELLAHEVAHVLQQRQGRVRPHARLGGVGVSVDPRLEAEADTVARRVCSGGPAGMIVPNPRATRTAVVQRKAALKRGSETLSEDDLSSHEVRAWLLERPQLKDLIPVAWWIGADRTQLRLVPLRPALKAVVAAPTDYGTFDLNKPDDVTRLCQAMIDLALATVTTPTPLIQQPVPTPPTPALPPEIVLVPPPAAEKSTREPQKILQAKYVTPDNLREIMKVLTDWKAYAESKRKPLLDKYIDLTQKRALLGDEYYSLSSEEFRREFKKVNQQRTNMSGAASECENVLRNLAAAATRTNDLSRFMALYHGDQLQGVVEWSSTAADYISNIVGNPNNIVPQDDIPAVPGVAKALVILTVTQYRAERALPSARKRGPIKLWALNNKVKGIYDYFHFQVIAGDKPIKRPPRGQKEKGQLGKLKPHKTTWHEENSMVITDEAATELLRKFEPGRWLEVPADLKPYLDLTRT